MSVVLTVCSMAVWPTRILDKNAFKVLLSKSLSDLKTKKIKIFCVNAFFQVARGPEKKIPLTFSLKNIKMGEEKVPFSFINGFKCFKLRSSYVLFVYDYSTSRFGHFASNTQ